MFWGLFHFGLSMPLFPSTGANIQELTVYKEVRKNRNIRQKGKGKLQSSVCSQTCVCSLKTHPAAELTSLRVDSVITSINI